MKNSRRQRKPFLKLKLLRPSFLLKPEAKFLGIDILVKSFKGELSKIETDSKFCSKTKVLDFYVAYNFHEGNFMKFKSDF